MSTLKDKIESGHFSYYERMRWNHPASCVCHQWENKPLTELEVIEQRLFESEEIKPEELGF